MRVSERIKYRDINTFKTDELITITCPMGSGKSHWVKTDLYNHCKAYDKKILFLVHRKILKDQFNHEINFDGKEDIIHMRTYQSLLSKSQRVDISEYDFIVCDESHSLLVDSSYNHYTDIYLKHVLSQENAVKIFMSATGERFIKYLKSKKYKIREYNIPIKFEFPCLQFYHNDSSLDQMVEQFQTTGEKAIFFLESLELAYEMYCKYKQDSNFVCSTYSQKYIKGSKAFKAQVDDTKAFIVENECFQEQFLFTTAVCDAGLNIKDEDVKHIIVDMRNTETLIQCLGRKRYVNEYDYAYVYIKAMNGNEIRGMIKTLEERVSLANSFIDLDCIGQQDLFIKENHRVNTKMIYPNPNDDSKLELNELMYFNDCENLQEYTDMIYPEGKPNPDDPDDKREMDFWGYSRTISNLLGCDGYCYVYEVEYKNNNIKEHLKELAYTELYADDKRKLIDFIDYRFDGHQIKSATKINKEFEIHNIPYTIKEERNKKYRYWMIYENIPKHLEYLCN